LNTPEYSFDYHNARVHASIDIEAWDETPWNEAYRALKDAKSILARDSFKDITVSVYGADDWDTERTRVAVNGWRPMRPEELKAWLDKREAEQAKRAEYRRVRAARRVFERRQNVEPPVWSKPPRNKK
jgi:hypothetical protein